MISLGLRVPLFPLLIAPSHMSMTDGPTLLKSCDWNIIVGDSRRQSITPIEIEHHLLHSPLFRTNYGQRDGTHISGRNLYCLNPILCVMKCRTCMLVFLNNWTFLFGEWVGVYLLVNKRSWERELNWVGIVVFICTRSNSSIAERKFHYFLFYLKLLPFFKIVNYFYQRFSNFVAV